MLETLAWQQQTYLMHKLIPVDSYGGFADTL